MTTSHGKVPEYSGDNFELFVQKLSFYFIATDVTDAGKRKAILLLSLPAEVFCLLSDVMSPAKVSDDAVTCECGVKTLHDLIKPVKSPRLSPFDNLVRQPGSVSRCEGS